MIATTTQGLRWMCPRRIQPMILNPLKKGDVSFNPPILGHEHHKPWSHKFQTNPGSDFSEFIWVAFISKFWVFHFSKFQVQGTMSISKHHQQKGWTHHYLEFQDSCLAFITKLVEQTQPKSIFCLCNFILLHRQQKKWRKKNQLLPPKPIFPLSSPNWIFFWGG